MALLAIAALLALAPPPVQDRYYCIATRDLPTGQLWVVQTMSLSGVRDVRQSGWFGGIPGLASLRVDWTGDYAIDTGKVELGASIYDDPGTRHRYRIEIRRDDGDPAAYFLSSPLRWPEHRQVRYITNIGVLRGMAQGVGKLTLSVMRDDGTVYASGAFDTAVIEHSLAEIPGLQREMDAMLADPAKHCQIDDPQRPIIVD